MKIKNIVIVLLGSVLLFSACSDLMEADMNDALSPDNWVVDEGSAVSTLMGVYSALQSDYATAGYFMMIDGVYGDNISHTGTYPDVADMWGNAPISSNIYVTRYWRDMYLTISRANYLIDRVSQLDTETQITPEAQAEIIAEAKVIRAYVYFRLVNYFDGVILRTAPLNDEFTNTAVPRSTVAQVYTQIENDLDDAELVLGNITGTARADLDVIRALRSKIALYQGNYAEVITYCDDIFGSGYALAINYDDIWDENKGQNEIIWALEYNTDDQNSLAWFLTVDGRSEVGVSPDLVAAFEAGDTRDNNFLLYRGSYYTYKYNDVASGSDRVVLYRLADFYLMYAEALCNIATPDFATATTYIDAVRTRAGLNDLATEGITLDATNWQDIIMQERRVELYAEGDRWLDLKRSGLAEDVISAKLGANFTAVSGSYELWPIPQDEIDANEALTSTNQNPGY